MSLLKPDHDAIIECDSGHYVAGVIEVTGGRCTCPRGQQHGTCRHSEILAAVRAEIVVNTREGA
jgi:hypothetical protein